MLAGATPAAADFNTVPLCKDLKGLFTPCPKGLNRPAQHKLEQRIEAAPAEHAEATPGARPVAVHRQKPRNIDFARGKLCRDTKGLYTPCPR